ncbi:MAG TPA: MFS transporter, partial [Planctomycetota bacterium]|nr:MFS transporter [Planctomycetota bacterium]
WGAWLPILYPFLLGHRHFTLDQCGWVLAAGATGAVFGPFLAGQVADRMFATEKFLAFSHLIGAAIVWTLAGVDTLAPFLVLSAIYGIVYAPTLALTNSLSFHHLPDRDRDFGKVRVWGTVGWIAAGILVGQWLLSKYTPAGAEVAVVEATQNAGRADAFRLSAVLGAIMGYYCFTLPHTPPSKDAPARSAIGEAFREVKRQPLLTLFLLAVPISCIHQFYFVFTSDFLSKYGRDTASSINKIFGVGGGGLMTIGQMSEILVLAAIPLVAKNVSRKTLLAIGITAYAARMALFAYGDSLELVLLGVALHGLCFGCFIFVAFMVVDEETSADVRASAQNLFNLVIVGVGIIVGSWIATSVVAKWATSSGTDHSDGGGAMDYRRLFSVPMYAALACLALLLVFYPARRAVAPVER